MNTVCAVLNSAVIAFLISKLISVLYNLPNAPLSFPQKKEQGSTFRIMFLSVALLAAITYCERFTFEVMLYKMSAAIFLLVIAVTDWEQYIIFDIVLFPFAVIGIGFGIWLEVPLLERLLAALGGGTAFFALMLATKNGIGGGDVKLVATLGLWLGADRLLSTVLIASILGGVVALVLILCGIKRRKDVFAYGPYFCIGAAFNIII